MFAGMENTTQTDQASFLDTFAAWLKSLGEDARKLSGLLEQASLPEPLRETIAGGLNYLFRSLDLVPDGIDDIGYLDDAFVMRVATEQALRHYDSAQHEFEIDEAIHQLVDDCEQVRAFLGDDYGRLEEYVRGLREGAARGRDAEAIITNTEVRDAFLTDVRKFADGFEAPSFRADERNLVKLKAFFSARLPRRRDSMLG